MSELLVTYDDALQSLGDVPNLGNRPTATNIRNLREDLCDKLEAIPSHQSLVLTDMRLRAHICNNILTSFFVGSRSCVIPQLSRRGAQF